MGKIKASSVRKRVYSDDKLARYEITFYVNIDEDGTWHHGVLYSHIDGTTLLVTTKKNFENNFQVIKQSNL